VSAAGMCSVASPMALGAGRGGRRWPGGLGRGDRPFPRSPLVGGGPPVSGHAAHRWGVGWLGAGLVLGVDGDADDLAAVVDVEHHGVGGAGPVDAVRRPLASPRNPEVVVPAWSLKLMPTICPWSLITKGKVTWAPGTEKVVNRPRSSRNPTGAVGSPVRPVIWPRLLIPVAAPSGGSGSVPVPTHRRGSGRRCPGTRPRSGRGR
jgi:hypothetical protein